MGTNHVLIWLFPGEVLKDPDLLHHTIHDLDEFQAVAIRPHKELEGGSESRGKARN